MPSDIESGSLLTEASLFTESLTGIKTLGKMLKVYDSDSLQEVSSACEMSELRYFILGR